MAWNYYILTRLSSTTCKLDYVRRIQPLSVTPAWSEAMQFEDRAVAESALPGLRARNRGRDFEVSK